MKIETTEERLNFLKTSKPRFRENFDFRGLKFYSLQLVHLSLLWCWILQKKTKKLIITIIKKIRQFSKISFCFSHQKNFLLCYTQSIKITPNFFSIDSKIFSRVLNLS